MLNDLMPNISRHFLYSLLTHNQNSGEAIIENIIESGPQKIDEFLSFLAMNLAGYFFRLDANLDGYDKIRTQVIEELKNLHRVDGMEGLN
jgi:hypothetical protein